MFGLGIGEIVVIVIVALVVLGPRRLPGIARQIGRAVRELRRAAYELQVNLEEATPPEIRSPRGVFKPQGAPPVEAPEPSPPAEPKAAASAAEPPPEASSNPREKP